MSTSKAYPFQNSDGSIDPKKLYEYLLEREVEYSNLCVQVDRIGLLVKSFQDNSLTVTQAI